MNTAPAPLPEAPHPPAAAAQLPAPMALPVFACALEGTHLVEASAGTGKTWNLCALYLRLLLERGLTVEQILVVTFTKAATAELRDRIRSRLVEARNHLAGAPVSQAGDPFVAQLLAALRARPDLDDRLLARRLELALQGFDQAAVSTIHGFCQRALAESVFTAQESADFEVTWDGEQEVREVVADFWRTHVAAPGTDPALVAHLMQARDTPERWARLLARRLGRPTAQLQWPAPPPGTPAGADAASLMLETLHGRARALWVQDRSAIVALLGASRPPLRADHYGDDALKRAAAEWDELLLRSAPSQALRWRPDRAVLLASRRLAQAAGPRGAPPAHPFFPVAEALLAAHAGLGESMAAQRTALLRHLLEQGPAAVQAERRRRRVLTFDDMLQRLHARLTDASTGPALAQALRQRYPAALIDEFQDTDPLQLGIFQTLYAGTRHGVFLIGDPKQAIYGFRNADLHTYLQARRHVQQVYTLSANQRSVPPLVEGVNALFGGPPRAFLLEGLDFHPAQPGQRPRPALVDPGGPDRAWDIRLLPGPGAGSELLPKAAAQLLALSACVREIVRLLQPASAVRLDDRALRAGDIAVLVRTRREGSLVKRALDACGVGSVESRLESIFSTPDAEELARVLQAVAEPTREKTLRTAWATSFIGMEAAEIERLGDDERALAQGMARMAAWRQTWLQRGVGVMLRQWMADEGVAARLLARSDGERRLTNLLHLVETLQAASYEHPSPAALLRWFERQRQESPAHDELQLRLESDANLVQIQTIHGAKGLEFPVVVCPFLWDGSTAEPPNDLGCRSYHDDEGQAVLDFREPDDAAKASIAREQAAERLRLLYVALTRAVNRCVLVGGCYTTVVGRKPSPRQSAHSLLNWLVAGAGDTPESWFETDRSPEAVESAWEALGARHPQALAVSRLAEAPAVRLQPAAGEAGALRARAAPARLPRGMRIASYSQLVKRAAAEAPGADHDERARTRPRPTPGSAPAPDDILGFPASAEAGQCIHTLFETIDFGDPGTWDGAIARALARFAHIAPRPGGAPASVPPAPPAAPPTALAPMLRRMLHDVLHTGLPVGTARPLRLAEVPAQQRLPELAFHFPTAGIPVAALSGLLAAHGYGEFASLSAGTLGRYLTGAIDLVFAHEGRYFIADWKSNLLGHAMADYGAEPVAQEMAAERYRLQYLLYTVALHRHLRRCLPGYAPATHLGGALYLFVRGVRPQWTDARGHPTGLHFDRPAPELVEAMSALLEGRPSVQEPPR
jgi:exodeoxyribonuclease V beta subunit